MKVHYDPSVDVLRIIFNDRQISESDEDKPGVIIDYDAHGSIVSLEILDASKVTVPASVQVEVDTRRAG